MTFIVLITDARDADPVTPLAVGGYYHRNEAEYFCHKANAVLVKEGSEDNQLKATVHELVDPTLTAVRLWARGEVVASAEAATRS